MYNISINNVNGEILWNYSTDDIEEIAGMAAVSLPILKDSNKNNIRYLLDTNADIKSYRRINNHPNSELDKYNCRDINDLSTGHEICNDIFNDIGDGIGIWINSGENRYIGSSLYRFKTNSFISGMIVFSLLFGKDFRAYIYDKPFKSDGTEYIYNEYSFNKTYIMKALPENFETELEETADDNINNPYGDLDMTTTDIYV